MWKCLPGIKTAREQSHSPSQRHIFTPWQTMKQLENWLKLYKYANLKLHEEAAMCLRACACACASLANNKQIHCCWMCFLGLQSSALHHVHATINIYLPLLPSSSLCPFGSWWSGFSVHLDDVQLWRFLNNLLTLTNPPPLYFSSQHTTWCEEEK